MSCLAFKDPSFAAVCLTCDKYFGTGDEEAAKNHERNKIDHSVYLCDCLLTDENKGKATLPCVQAECTACALFHCPHKEPLHYHHDACPACYDESK